MWQLRPETGQPLKRKRSQQSNIICYKYFFIDFVTGLKWSSKVIYLKIE